MMKRRAKCWPCGCGAPFQQRRGIEKEDIKGGGGILKGEGEVEDGDGEYEGMIEYVA